MILIYFFFSQVGAINFPKACLVSDATAAALRKKLEHTNNTIITIADEYRSTLSTLNIGEVCGRREFLLYLEIKSIESFIDVLVSAFVLTRKEAHFHFLYFALNYENRQKIPAKAGRIVGSVASKSRSIALAIRPAPLEKALCTTACMRAYNLVR